MTELRKIRRALLSVSDKTNLIDLAEALEKHGVEIISTGGTAAHIREAGIAVTDVSDVTGFPEMMDGRVKTLHPKIHGAFLALRDNDDHVASMRDHDITPIDLVVVNLYPFEKTIAKEGVTLAEAVEQIDIGGPAMIRSAAKNWRDVAVVVAPQLYGMILNEISASDGALSLETRQRLASLAYTRTANYDFVISNYLADRLEDRGVDLLELALPFSGMDMADDEEPDLQAETPLEGMPQQYLLQMNKAADLRYGENPHQSAAIYSVGFDYPASGIANAKQLHGKEMSFNNYVDADAAWALVNDFDELAVAIIKHTNPSGVGLGTTNEEAYARALATDPVSAFGGIIAFNRMVDGAAAASVIEVFSEVIVAPGYDEKALALFRTKKNLRVLQVRNPSAKGEQRTAEIKQISGGFLLQESDDHKLSENDLEIVTNRQPTADELQSMHLAWTVAKHVKSNAIVFANPTQTLGVGAGQMNRVDSVRIAAMRGRRFDLDLKGSALASDAFFPFRDNVDEAAKFGVTAIVQPGGSIKDYESIAAAEEHGIAMAFTGIRHFRH